MIQSCKTSSINFQADHCRLKFRTNRSASSPCTSSRHQCWKSEPELDSSIWASTNSVFPCPGMAPTCSLLVELSCLGLDEEERTWQLESGVSGSRWEDNESSHEMLLKMASVSPLSLPMALSWMGDSEAGAGVDGSVFSESKQWPTGVGAVVPAPGNSASTPLSRCCSSMIFFRYLPWASILSCSCLCTCQ